MGKSLYIVDDETVVNCDHNHRVIIYASLDKSKAEEFLKEHYTLKMREIELDMMFDNIGVLGN